MSSTLLPQKEYVFESTDLMPPHFGFLHRERPETDFVRTLRTVGSRRAIVREPVSVWHSGLRKLQALSIVSRREPQEKINAESYFDRMSYYHRQLAGSRSMQERVHAIWRAENFSFTFFLAGKAEVELSDHRLAHEVRPVAHTGLGMAALYHVGPDFERLQGYIETFGDSDYSFFAYESLGVMMGIQPRDFFGRSMRFLARFGLVEPLPPAGAWEALSQDVQQDTKRILAHGLGRFLYFKHLSFDAALRAAQKTETFSTEALLRGITAAYVMVNSTILPKTLRLVDAVQEPQFKRAVCDGLINVMAFFEWMAPGCLATLPRLDSSHAILVRVAEKEARAARGECLPPPFALGRLPRWPSHLLRDPRRPLKRVHHREPST
jgi:hypothetical protein